MLSLRKFLNSKPSLPFYSISPGGASSLTNRRTGRARHQSGQSLIEYLIIVALVAIGSISIVKSLGETINVRFGNIAQALQHRDANLSPTAITHDQVKKRELDDFFKDATGFGPGGR